MAYCDYEFYTTSYMGNVIPEADFARVAEKASDKLDQITFDRLIDGLPSDIRIQSKIKKAVCRIAELVLDIESAENAARSATGFDKGADGLLRGKAIASISAGGESISFASGNIQALTDKKMQDVLYYEAAKEYLSGTGLLYAGL